MSVRACCLLLLGLLSGCQTTSTVMFPWSKDADDTLLSEAELNEKLGRTEVRQEAFEATAQAGPLPAAVRPPETPKQDRIQQWLERGHQAIEEADHSPQRERMLAEATRSFREALRGDPDNVDAFHGMAIVADLQEDWDLAEMNYKRALQERPDDVNLLNDLGYSYVLQDRYDEAWSYLNRVMELDPRHRQAQINLAILDVKRGNLPSARSRLSGLYHGPQLELAMSELVQEHRPSAVPVSPPPFVPRQVPTQLASSSRPLAVQRPEATSGYQGQPSVELQPHSAAHPPQRHPTMAGPQASFDQLGVIQTHDRRQTSSGVRPVAASQGPEWPRSVAPAAMQTRVPQSQPGPVMSASTPSAMQTARPVGGRFQNPASPAFPRPQLPASANVYNPDQTRLNGMAPSVPHGTQVAGMNTAGAIASPDTASTASTVPQHMAAPQASHAASMAQPSMGHAAHAAPASQVTSQNAWGFEQPVGQLQQIRERAAARNPAPAPGQGAGQGAGQLPPSTAGAPPVHVWPEQTLSAGRDSMRHMPPQGHVSPAGHGHSPVGNRLTPPHQVMQQVRQSVAPAPWSQPGNMHPPAPPANGYESSHGPASAVPGPGNTPMVHQGAVPGLNGVGAWSGPAAPSSWGPGGAAGQQLPPAAQHPAAPVHPAGWGTAPGSTGAAPGTYNHGPARVPAASFTGASPSAPGGTPAPPSLAPPHFSPPPLSGPGYQDPHVTAPDPLQEYRATLQQRDTDYQRTVRQAFQGQLGGNSFQ